MKLRAAFAAALFAISGTAVAQTTVFDLKALFDVDNNAATGCSVSTFAGSLSGVDQVVSTRVELTGSSAVVKGVTRQACTTPPTVLGSPVTVDSNSWPAGLNPTTKVLFVESRMPVSDLTSGPLSNVRVGFSVTSGGLGDAVLQSTDSHPVTLQAPAPFRRRSGGSGSPERVITLDGASNDWDGLPSIAGAGIGSPALRIVNVTSYVRNGQLFLAYTLQANANAPHAVDDAYTAPGGGSLNVPAPGVLGNDFDPSGKKLTAKVDTPPQHGTLTLSPDGSFTYLNDGSVSSSDSFRYKANNGADDSGAAQVNLSVTTPPGSGGPTPPGPFPPQFTSPNTTTFQVGNSGGFEVAANGHPTPDISLTTGTLPTGVTFTPVAHSGDPGVGTGVLLGVPAAGTGGAYPLVFTATSPLGAPTQNFTLFVNQPPAITSANATTFIAGTAGSFSVTVTGFPAPAVSMTGALPTGVTFNASTKTLSGTPGAGTGGVYPIVFTAANGVGSNAQQNFTLTVNEAPFITTAAQNLTVCTGATATFTAAAGGFPAPTVQWQVNGGSGFTNIPGATSTTLSFTAAAADSGKQYRAVFTNSVGSANTTATLTVNVPPSVTTNPVTQTICAGLPVTFTAAATATPAASVQWQVDSGSGFTNLAGATSTTVTFTTAAGDNGKQYRAVFTNACGSSNTTAATLTVNVGATVTSHPTSVTVCTGATASFTVGVSGTPAPAIQWQVDSGSGFTNIGGATSATYSFATTASDSGKQYRAVVTNSCATVNSNAATLTVNVPPAVTTNPITQTICAGSPVTFTAAASGTPAPSVQWQVNPGTGFTNIAGATSTTLTFTTAASDTGKQYRAVFTNICNTATTTAATLTVNVAPAITTNPISQTVCAGASVSFTAAASGTPAPSVQWQVDGGSGFTNIGGATSATYTFTAVAGDNNKQYRAVFTNSCGVATSTAASLRVDTLPVVNVNPLTQTVCAGSPVTFTAGATSNAGQTVQWQVDSGSGFTNIGGATGLSYTHNAAAGETGYKYRAVFTNACGSANSSAATLSVDSLATVTTNPTSQIVCAGGTSTFTAAATSNANDHTVQWQVSTDGINFNNIGGATTTTLSFVTVAGDNGKQYRAVFTDACGSTNTTAATLRVDTLPTVSTHPLSQTICATSNVTFTVAASSNAGQTVQWERSTNGGALFTPIAGATSLSYTHATTAAENTYQYRAVFTNACGNTTTNAATLTVDTLPVVTTNPTNQVVCAGANATFTAAATSNASDHTVQWQVSTNGGANWNNVGGATSTTLSFATVAGDNGKQFRAQFTNSCGTTTTSSASLRVDTLPSIVTNPLSQTICAGANVTFTAAASSNAGQTVQWEVSTNNGGSFSPIGGATGLSYTHATAAGETGYQYHAVFTNACGSTTGSAATLTVDTLPVVNVQPTTQTACANTSVSFTAGATSNASDHTVQWQVNSGSGFTNIGGATATTYTFTAQNSDNGNQYRAVFTDICGSTNSNAATLTLNIPASVTTPPSNQTVCAGATATFTVVAGGNPTPSVQWEVSTNGGGSWSPIALATSTTYSFTTVAGDNTKQYRAVLTNLCNTATSTAATLRVDTLPVVNTNPLTQAICALSPVTFTAAASSNAGQTVQWEVSTNGGGSWSPVGGATSTTLTFNTAASQNGNQYHAVFTNSCGSATTTAATLVVDTLPTINTQPLAQTVCAGATATFTAAATSNAGQTVQWEVSTNGGGSWAPVGGATSTTLSFTTTTGQNGNQYRAVFSNTCGNATTNAVALRVDTLPTVNTHPLTQAICATSPVTFTAAASSNAGQTVQWEVSTDNGANWAAVGGATSTTLTFNTTTGQNGNQYHAVFTNSCGNATTNAATLRVDTLPVINTQPATQAICSGAPVTFTVAATSNAGQSVQWEVSTDSGANWTPIGGATSTSLTFNTANADNGKQYHAVLTNACGVVTSNAATLRVDTLPTVNTHPLTQAVCAGSPVTFTAAASSNAGQTVQWEVSSDGGGTWTPISGETSTTLSFASATAAQTGKQYHAVFTNSCGNTASAAATLTVDTLPTVNTDPTNQTACAGGTANFTAAASSNAGQTVQWQVKVPAGSFTDLPGATSTTLSFTTTAGQNGNEYRAIFTNTCGSATTAAATLTVDTLPVVVTNPLTQTVCAGATVNLSASATSNANDHTVQWQVKVPAGSFTNIPGATSTTLSFTSTAGMNGNQYQAVFTDFCGNATTSVATLTVDTLPVVTTNPLTQTVCAGATATFTAAATSNASDHTVQWQVDNGGGFANIVGATSTTLSFTANFSQNGYQYRAVFTDACGSTNTTTATLTVNTAPLVTLDPTNTTVCATTTASFSASASGSPSPTVQWQVSTDGGTIYNNIVGATSTTYTFSTVAADNTKKYRAVFTNVCGTATTAAATLTVNTAPAVTTNPISQSVQSGSSVTFTAAASGTPVPTVQWQVSVASGPFSDIGGATSTSYTHNAALSENGNQYRAVFTNSCGTATTTAATLTVTCPAIAVSRNPSGVSFPQGMYNTAYTGESVIASGGSGSYTFAVTSGSLPTSLLLASNGGISGTPSAVGSFTFTVTATDTNTNCTGSQAFTINIGPKVTNDVYAASGGNAGTTDSVGNTQSVAAAFSTPTSPYVSYANSVLANDSSNAAMTVSTTTVNDATFGTITFNTSGGWSYVPKLNFIGTATFAFNVVSGGITTGSSVSIAVSNKVWYVDNSGANGNGTSSSPFNTLAGAVTASAAGDIIYVSTGGSTYNAATATTGVLLKANQQLIGAGVALVVNTNTLKAAGTKPTITNGTATSDAITLAAGNTIKGIKVSNATRDGISGNAVAGFTGDTLEIGDNTTATNGNVSSGLHLVGMTGTVTMTNSTIRDDSGTATSLALDISGGSGGMTFDNTNTITSASGTSVSIAARTGGTIDVGATITANGKGIVITNSGASGTPAFNFTGNQTLTTTTNPGLTVGGAGVATAATTFSGTLIVSTTSGSPIDAQGSTNTLTITGVNNTMAATAGTGNVVNINGVKIGGSGITFKSADITGGATGINVVPASGSGTFTIAGNGGACANGTDPCSGGTIQNQTTAGISNSGTVAINNVKISGAVNGVSTSGTNPVTTLSTMFITGGTNGMSLAGGASTATTITAVVITAATNNGIIGTTFGTLTLSGSANSVSAANALNLTTGIVTGGNFSSVTSTLGSVTLSGVSGTWGTTGGSLTGNAGSTFSVTGGASGTITWGASISASNAFDAVTISGSNAQTINFSGAITTSGTSTGINISSSSGSYVFAPSSASVIGGTGGGITLATVTGGPISFNGQFAINAATTSFKLSGTSSANITYSGTLTNNANGGLILDINNSTAGTYSGVLNFNNAGASAYQGNVGGNSGVIAKINSIAGASASFSISNLNLASTNVNFNNSVVAIGGTNTSGSFTFNNLTLSAPGNGHTGTGLSASGGGTLSFTGTTSITASAAALDLTGMALAASSLGTVTSTGGTYGVKLVTCTGGTLTMGGALSGHSAAGAAFFVDGGSASATYSGTISESTAAKLVDIGSTTAVGGVLNFTGTVGGGSTLAGGGISVQRKTSGSVTFPAMNIGTISPASASANNGVVLASNTGGTINFGNLVVNTTVAAAGFGFSATGGGAINFNGTVDLKTTTGTAFNWSGATTTTGNANITINDVTSTTGTAVKIATSGLAFIFHAINANGATTGISVTDLTGSFTVNGTSSTAGTGGTIQSCTLRGAEFIVSAAANVTNAILLKNMNFTSNGTSGTTSNPCTDGLNLSTTTFGSLPAGCQANIYLTRVNGFTLNNVTANSSKGHGIWGWDVTGMSLTSCTVNSNGDATFEDGVQIANLKGTNTFTSCTMRDNAKGGIEVQNNSGGTTTIGISGGFYGNTVSPGAATTPSTSTAGDVLLLATNGTNSGILNSTVTGATFSNIFGRALNANTEGNTSATIVFGSGASANTISNVSYGTDFNGTTSGNVTYTIDNNTFTNTSGSVTLGSRTVINARKGFGATGNWSGTVTNNKIGTNGVAKSGCDAVSCGGIAIDSAATAGNYDVVVTGNTINRVNGHGIDLANTAAGTMRVRATGNSSLDPDDGTTGAGGNQGSGLIVTTTGTGANINALIGGGTAALKNTVTGNWGTQSGGTLRGVRYSRGKDTVFCISGYSGPFDSTSVGTFITSQNTGNAGSATQSLVDSPPRQYSGSNCPTP
jgi:hypothetical protein